MSRKPRAPKPPSAPLFPPEGKDPLRARLAEISRLLAGRYGRPSESPHRAEAVRNLILTILSQNTADRNRDRAFARLTERYPSIPKLAAGEIEEVAEAIRPAGLAHGKAQAILSALNRLWRERGAYTLDFLSEMPLPEARAYLTSFPGVGMKTANILLLFSFGRHAFPVDTHILRVTKRLGLVPPSADLAKAALLLEPHVPPGEPIPLHLNLIRLGREICRPRGPAHSVCPLLPVCPEGRRALGLDPPPAP
jgi:endonuclease-3